MTLDDLVTQLRHALGDALQSVVLYGSAARGEEVAGSSDLNVLLIASSIGVPQLRQLGSTMRAWQEAGNPPVLVLTHAEWHGSADIFPMEYADILERHRVLHGTFSLEDIVVRPHDLRLQVEHEAMGKLLRLRRGVAVAGTDHKRQEELLRASLSSLLVLFRSVLRLHGQHASQGAEQVIEAVSARCGFDGTPFKRAASLRSGGSLPKGEAETVLAGYLDGITRLVAYLDAFVTPDATSAADAT
jgi:hypothetical protein